MNDLLECSGPQMDWFRPDKGAWAGHPVLARTHLSFSRVFHKHSNDDPQVHQGMIQLCEFSFSGKQKEGKFCLSFEASFEVIERRD